MSPAKRGKRFDTTTPMGKICDKLNYFSSNPSVTVFARTGNSPAFDLDRQLWEMWEMFRLLALRVRELEHAAAPSTIARNLNRLSREPKSEVAKNETPDREGGAA